MLYRIVTTLLLLAVLAVLATSRWLAASDTPAAQQAASPVAMPQAVHIFVPDADAN